MKTTKILLWIPLCLLGLLFFCTWFKAQAQQQEDARPVVDDSKVAPEKAADPKLPTLFVVGDSTLRSNAPLRGWGQEIGAFFDPAKINVVDRAIGGRSSRTFQNEGRWAKVLAEIKPGDFVIVQFGHNDNGNYADPAAKGRPSLRSEGEETVEVTKPDGTHETVHSFGWYMRKYCTDAKTKGARPILCSMVPHKVWIGDKIKRDEKDTFVKWTADAAAATGSDFIDLNALAATTLEQLGPAGVAPLFGDARTHSTPAGAALNAQCVVSGLRALAGAPLDPYLSPKGLAVTAAAPDFVVSAGTVPVPVFAPASSASATDGSTPTAQTGAGASSSSGSSTP